MGEKVFPPGTFCWVELGTNDAAAAREFYSSLLGWDTDPVEMGDMGTYTLLKLDSSDIAGLYPLSDDLTRQGVVPQWLSYVHVEEVDASANKATELGGQVMMGPFDVPNVGRMAIVRDPTRAVFALFQPGEYHGAVPMDNRPGMFCWNELATPAPSAAKAFYSELFGWEAEDTEGPMGTYTFFRNDGRLAGGMIEIADPSDSVAPNWLVYFAVDDCDRAVQNAERGGGRVLVAPSDIPDVGRFAVMTDPQGATFAMIALDVAEAN